MRKFTEFLTSYLLVATLAALSTYSCNIYAQNGDNSDARPSGESTEVDKPEVKSLKQKILKLSLEKKKQQLEHELKIQQLKAQKEKLNLQNEIYSEKQKKKLLDLKEQKFVYDTDLTKLRLQKARLESELLLLKKETAQISEDIQLLQKKKQLKNYSTKEYAYRINPISNGVLHISDRRVELNGPILLSTAREITEKIQFYNNASQVYPIFVVIEYSPGGSVMAGSRIVNAIANSKAPVYVVVKSYAASMSATITALAEHSVALPDTIFLHHQVRGINAGNLTVQKENLEIAREWSSRVVTPVARKMGLSHDQFVKKMYENNSQGDWVEFAPEAAKLKWVTTVVNEIRDRSVDQLKDEEESLRVRRSIKLNMTGSEDSQLETSESGKSYILSLIHI